VEPNENDLREKVSDMRIWASLDDYLSPGNSQKLVGRSVANHRFFKALLEYAHFDEYHFFLENNAHMRLFQEEHGPWLRESGLSEKVKLFHCLDLPRMATSIDYTVFHQADHLRHFNDLCYFRNQTGAFPVTAFIHTLSYPRSMHKYLELLMGGATTRDAIICSSLSGKKVLENYFEQLSRKTTLSTQQVILEVIPFGFDGRGLQRLGREQCRKRLNLPVDEVTGLCFGRFSEYDKMDLFPLLQAFQRIYPKGKPWRLILAGAAHSSSYVEMLKLWARALNIGERIMIRTDVAEDEKWDLYGAADFFVSPSDNLQETFGLTLLEAMAAGLPLIVSDFDGYREIATTDLALRIPTCWASNELFSSSAIAPLLDEALWHRCLAQSITVDLDRLATALKAFFEQPELRVRMGRKARQRFDAHYDYRNVIGRLETLWEDLKGRWSVARRERDENPIFPDFFHAFSHYVTETISSATALKCTSFGETLLRSGASYPLFEDMGRLIDPDSVKRIIASSREPITVSELMSRLGGTDKAAFYQVLWMLKHGLLQRT
jgi:glycosyltransferase involved in cell wall biosynthesis